MQICSEDLQVDPQAVFRQTSSCSPQDEYPIVVPEIIFSSLIFTIDNMFNLGIFGSTVLIKLFLSKAGWTGEVFTKCNRCSGIMIYKNIYYRSEHFGLWKCLYCGEYVDQVILDNHQIQKSNREESPKNNEEPIYRS